MKSFIYSVCMCVWNYENNLFSTSVMQFRDTDFLIYLFIDS